VTRPRLLDLFCGAGGAAVGYHRAGFDVTGVDNRPQPHYPYTFLRADAMDVLANGNLDGFDAIHASPPCQADTTMSNRYRGKGGKADSHPDLIGPVHDLLIASGAMYVMENVVGARRKMSHPIVLAGSQFGLGVHRPRLFESNVLLLLPPRAGTGGRLIGVYGERADGRRLNTRADGYVQRAAASIDEARAVMGIDWMDWAEITQAIPPAYTEYIGAQLLDHLRSAA
jgi:DNA (cytosine-5)-methyltransferase 1